MYTCIDTYGAYVKKLRVLIKTIPDIFPHVQGNDIHDHIHMTYYTWRHIWRRQMLHMYRYGVFSPPPRASANPLLPVRLRASMDADDKYKGAFVNRGGLKGRG